MVVLLNWVPMTSSPFQNWQQMKTGPGSRIIKLYSLEKGESRMITLKKKGREGGEERRGEH